VAASPRAAKIGRPAHVKIHETFTPAKGSSESFHLSDDTTDVGLASLPTSDTSLAVEASRVADAAQADGAADAVRLTRTSELPAGMASAQTMLPPAPAWPAPATATGANEKLAAYEPSGEALVVKASPPGLDHAVPGRRPDRAGSGLRASTQRGQLSLQSASPSQGQGELSLEPADAPPVRPTNVALASTKLPSVPMSPAEQSPPATTDALSLEQSGSQPGSVGELRLDGAASWQPAIAKSSSLNKSQAPLSMRVGTQPASAESPVKLASQQRTADRNTTEHDSPADANSTAASSAEVNTGSTSDSQGAIAIGGPVLRAVKQAIPPELDPRSIELAEAAETTEATGLSIDEPDTANQSPLVQKLTKLIRKDFPSSRVHLTTDEDGLVVEGVAASEKEAKKILAMVRQTALCPVADRIITKR
jgi:hypothetical protein